MNTNPATGGRREPATASNKLPVDAFLDVVARLVARAHLRRITRGGAVRDANQPKKRRATERSSKRN